MTIFKDALRSTAAGIVSEYNVLHIAAELTSDDLDLERARHEILMWAQRRSGSRLPSEALAGRSFEILNAGRNSSAVEVYLPDIYVWALRQEDPDKSVAGRIWTSEAILWRAPNRLPQLASRLMVASRENELDIKLAAPGYIRQIVDNTGLTSARRQLHSAPWYYRRRGRTGFAPRTSGRSKSPIASRCLLRDGPGRSSINHRHPSVRKAYVGWPTWLSFFPKPRGLRPNGSASDCQFTIVPSEFTCPALLMMLTPLFTRFGWARDY